MDSFATWGKNAVTAWEHFVANERLTSEQAEKFKLYSLELLSWNEKKNLTAITDVPTLLADHFQDSLAVTKFVQFVSSDALCDVGSGGGFPGIPLAIMHPELPVVLMEVNLKKVAFLQAMKEKLALKNIEISSLDWRTFLRKAPNPVTYFVARASLKPDELVRVFKPGSAYNQSMLVYWASAQWQPEGDEKQFLTREESYTVNHKKRRLIFFQKNG